ncbi:hypothetical protein AAFF_G00205610 [Aldrovandia affinis]|uniref:Uncharacterized protein n=1 Tax=Aldrovandia affinis TaxID=143900 RepID=A0AAD7RHH9_9TELE|nr:hypothetical protein AAFF_G00205610 [Aldrovandia affinis]
MSSKAKAAQNTAARIPLNGGFQSEVKVGTSPHGEGRTFTEIPKRCRYSPPTRALSFTGTTVLLRSSHMLCDQEAFTELRLASWSATCSRFRGVLTWIYRLAQT